MLIFKDVFRYIAISFSKIKSLLQISKLHIRHLKILQQMIFLRQKTDSWQQTKASYYHTVKLYQCTLMQLWYNRLAQDIKALKTWKPKAVPLDNLGRTRAHHKTCPVLNFSEPRTTKALQEPPTPKRKPYHSSLRICYYIFGEKKWQLEIILSVLTKTSYI